MCSPFYCPTLELKSSNLSAAHNAKVQILLLNLCSISRTWSCYKKKKKSPLTHNALHVSAATLCQSIIQKSWHPVVFLSIFPFSNVNIQAFLTPPTPPVCLKSCPCASGKNTQTHVTATHLAYQFNILHIANLSCTAASCTIT